MRRKSRKDFYNMASRKVSNTFTVAGKSVSLHKGTIFKEIQPKWLFIKNKVTPGRFRSHHVSLARLALRPIQPPNERVPAALSLGLKQPGREVGHSSSSRVEVKNKWSNTSTSRIFPRIRITLTPTYAHVFQVVSFFQSPPPKKKLRTHFTPSYTPPIATSTYNVDSNYAVFSICFVFFSLRTKHLPQHLFSRTHSMWQTKFQLHTK